LQLPQQSRTPEFSGSSSRMLDRLPFFLSSRDGERARRPQPISVAKGTEGVHRVVNRLTIGPKKS
jgi:hypothetical protein